MAKKKQATRLSPAAISALRSAKFDGCRFTLTQDDLACYAEIKALVTSLGGRWVPKTRTHDFSEGVDAMALVVACCDRGEIPPSNKHDYYPTLPAVSSQMVEMDDFSSKWDAVVTCAEMAGRPVRYCEPNGGSGALAAIMYARLRENDEMVIIEINPLMAASLRVRYPRATVIEADFLTYRPEKPFDLILMNPPFAGKEYQAHVRHAFQMLRPFGIMAAIVPTGYRDHDEFSAWANVEGTSRDLGAEQFADTKIATSILWLYQDPENHWRDRPFDGFSSWHAWNAVAAISSDGDVLRDLGAMNSDEQRYQRLCKWCRELTRDGCPQSMTPEIAREVFAELGDYLPERRTEPVDDDAPAGDSFDSERFQRETEKVEQLTMELNRTTESLLSGLARSA